MNLTLSPLMFFMAGVIGLISAYLAHKRGRNPYYWFFIGFLFGALGIFAIFFTPGNKKKEPVAAPPTPVLTFQGPIDKLWYYLDSIHQQQGPMSHNALKAAWKEGKLNLSTYVWHEELPEWKALQEFVK